MTQHYLDVIERILRRRSPAEISVKLTQLGLDLDREFCYANLVRLIERYASRQNALDRHGAEPVRGRDARSLRARAPAYANVGVCVQAYLYRTEKDLD